MEPTLLDSAVAFALASETSMPRDLEVGLTQTLVGQPYNEIVGPMKERGGPNGIVLRYGYIVAEWGDTRRVDMTFSVTKSFLSAVAGLAVDRGMIRDVDDPVRDYVDDGGFDSDHNAAITWRMLLQQTNEWEGTLWEKPDVADRRRGRDRELQEPGTFWEYNDVRVNRTSLSLLRAWNRPLPAVLREAVMDPISASDTWRWHGYRNSYVTIDGENVQSVSGGGHWGGGMWISARDLARFGYLYLRRGVWQSQQVLSKRWIEKTLVPCEIQPTYGYMWWLNTEGGMWPSAPETSFAALGGGTNIVWVDPEHDLVAVVRWIERGQVDAFLSRLLASVTE
jgi:CubicO group peptidase (beta-lactamase class C family)